MPNHKITVGIPTYNEEKNIASTLESILNQDFKDLEIIVSDNNSTDNTREIVKKISNQYPNIKLIHNKKNLGALANWNNLIKHANSEYFAFAGAHDLWSSNYLKELVDALDNDKNAVLAYGGTKWIDGAGTDMGVQTGFIDTSGFKVTTRYNLTFWNNQHAMYGVMRLPVVKKTRMQKQIIGSGAVFLNEMSLFGSFVYVDNVIWYRREVREPETREKQMRRYYKNLFKRKRIRLFPSFRFFLNYLQVPFIRSGVSFSVKITLFWSTFFNLFMRYKYFILEDFKSLLFRWFIR